MGCLWCLPDGLLVGGGRWKVGEGGETGHWSLIGMDGLSLSPTCMCVRREGE